MRTTGILSFSVAPAYSPLPPLARVLHSGGARAPSGNNVTNDSSPLPPYYRRNASAVVVDYISFTVAFTFISLTSVLPAFVRQLTDSALVVGLTTAIYYAGLLLPQALIARLTADKPRKRPYAVATLAGRVAIWIIALALWAGVAKNPTAMLVVFLVCLAIFVISDGGAIVTWMDIMARAIPAGRRARLFGSSQALSAIVGVGVGALISIILGNRGLAFPRNYALLFTLAAVSMVPSTVALVAMREPPARAETSVDKALSGRKTLAQAFRDRRFRRMLNCRLLIGLMNLAAPFYVVHAQDVLHLPERTIGTFTIAYTVATIAASLLLGALGERRGPHAVIRVAAVAAAVSPLYALAAHIAGAGWLVTAYPIVFVGLGIVNSTWIVGFANYILELAPEGSHGAYIGVGNTVLGLLSVAPIVGGWLLEVSSYTVLFGLTAIGVLVGFAAVLRLEPATARACDLEST